MGLVKEISTQDEWVALIGSLPKTTTLIIFFHAPWAAPCARMASVIEAIAQDYSEPGAPATCWVSINAEEITDVSEMYDVVAVPFVVIQRNDQVLDTLSGSNAAALRELIEKHAPLRPKPADKEDDEEGLTPEEELNNRLKGLINAAPVMLFMKGTPNNPQCGFSRQIVTILRDRNVKYGFFNILADDDVRQGLKKLAEWPTYPQLWVEGELVGGLDILKEELDKDPDFLRTYSAVKQNGVSAA